ncbi:coiled-coil domain-containing protein [Helicobacter pullorum]
MKIFLFGGSNSILADGLQKGFKDLGVILYNRAVGGTDSMQNLYELIRVKDSREISECDLIVCESNVNERFQNNPHILYRQVNWFYQELSKLNKRVLILLLPHLIFKEKRFVNNIHKRLSLKYGFNVIDMQAYYEKYNLLEFTNSIENSHPQRVVMRNLAKSIVLSLNFFQKSSKLKLKDKTKFLIHSPESCIYRKVPCSRDANKLEESKILIGREFANSVFSEKFYRINKDIELSFSEKYVGGVLLGIHAWNNGIEELDNSKNWELKNSVISQLKITNTKNSHIVSFPYMNFFCNVFIDIDKDTTIKYNAIVAKDARYILDHCDIVNFFIATSISNEEQVDFETLVNGDMKIPENYNFSHLIPDVKLYKEIIDEYCARMDPIKLAPLQTQLQQKDQIIQTKNQELESKNQELTSKTQELTQTKNQLDSTKQQLDFKVKELESKTKELSSLPIKKQTLEIKNLEQDLINKQLHTKQLEKELGYESNVLKELELKNQQLTQTKNQLDSTKKELELKNKQLESANKILSSNPNTSHLIQNTSNFKGKLAYLNTLTTAKDRIHNHLSYKLGQAMIENSKSLLGYIRMPYVLSYIKDKHKQEQQQYQEAIKKNPNLKLPNLESYPDYKESLKEKECLTYKLGEAFIKASKTWYKGGYVKLWFEVRKLKGEYIECKR